jgi:thioredoxin 1
MIAYAPPLLKPVVLLGQETPPAAPRVQEIGDAEFQKVVLAAPKAVVKFYSPSCPYSQRFAPIYETLAAQHPDVVFAAVDVTRHIQQAAMNNVQMLPTVVFFANGKAVGRIDGVQDPADFEAQMAKAFGTAPATPSEPPAVPKRGGTLVDVEETEAPSSIAPYVLGGVAAAGLLTAAYFLFIK